MGFMKILLVNSHSDSSDGGGMSLIVQELSQKPAERGNECTMVLPGERAEAHVQKSGLVKYTIPSFGDVMVVLPVLDEKNIKKMYQYIKEFDPDIIHLHNFSFRLMLLKNPTPLKRWGGSYIFTCDPGLIVV